LELADAGTLQMLVTSGGCEVYGVKDFFGGVISAAYSMPRRPKKEPSGFGLQIDVWRLETGLATRGALADRMGMEGTALSKILNRTAPPTAPTLYRLAEALGRDAAEVFRAAGVPLKRTTKPIARDATLTVEDFAALARRAYERADHDKKAMLLDIIRAFGKRIDVDDESPDEPRRRR
jgi:transcriptional regulator with XRE-family HTH domain